MTEGWPGVQRYRMERLKEVQMLNMEKIAFFHDAARKLECVNDVHRNIFFNKRQHDPLTSAICAGLLNDMLYEDATHRLSSLDLVNRVQNILDSAKPIQGDDPTPSKLKRHRTEPFTSQKAEPLERRTQSTSNKNSKYEEEYATMVETPMRDMSLAESDGSTMSSKARGKRPVGAHNRGSWSQQPIAEGGEGDEDEEVDNDNDVQQTFGPIVDSPRPAHKFISIRRPPRESNSPRGSPNATGRSDSFGTAFASHHNRSDSRISGVNSKELLEIPELTFNGASYFMNEKKRGNREAYLPWADKLKGKLQKRDHVRFPLE